MAGHSPFTVFSLLEKMRSADADIRYMAVNDLMTELGKNTATMDPANEKEVVAAIIKLLEDNHGSVQNIAVKCLAPLVLKIKEPSLQEVTDKLCVFLIQDEREELRDIASIGLKTVIVEFSTDSPIAANLCRRLLPKLLEQLASAKVEAVQIDILEIISEVLSRFGMVLASDGKQPLLTQVQQRILPMLSHNRPAVRKRASVALAHVVTFGSEEMFATVSSAVLAALTDERDSEKLRTYLSTASALSRSSPQRVGKSITQLVPAVMRHLDEDSDELREACLQTLESLVLRCPTEMTPYITSIVQSCLTYVKYDPNYAASDDEEDETAESRMDLDDQADDDGDEEQEDDDDDEEEEDGYSDDDDLSWKVRRASAKLLSAIAATRPELLAELVRTVGPALIRRFVEREENVRIDILQAYTTLATQAATFRAHSHGTDGEQSHRQLKRARMDVDADDAADSANGLVRSQVALLCKLLPRQLQGKSIATRRAGFALLQQVLRAAPSSLDAHLGALVKPMQLCLVGSGHSHSQHQSHTNSDIKIEVLSFLNTLFTTTNDIRRLQQHTATLSRLVLDALGDKFYKVVAEALCVLTTMVRLARPIDDIEQSPSALQGVTADTIEQYYKAVQLRITASDEEVKDAAIAALGVLVAHAGDLLTAHSDEWSNALLDRLRNEITRLTAVKAVTNVAESPLRPFDSTKSVSDIATEVAGLLRKSNRTLREASIRCLEILVRQYHKTLSPQLLLLAVTDSAPIIAEAELHSVPLAIELNTTLLKSSAPSSPVRQRIASDVLPSVVKLIQSSLVHGSAVLDALLSFLEALVKTLDAAAAQSLLQVMTNPATTNVTQEYSKQTYSTMAECTAVVSLHTGNRDRMVDELVDLITQPASSEQARLYSLLVLGELGRRTDLSGHKSLDAAVLELLNAESEDVKSAAAFALGSIAIGNIQQYLPIIIREIKGQTKRSYLLFHAIKETISRHSNPQALRALEQYAGDLWYLLTCCLKDLLFVHCEGQVEGTRAVISECLGRLVQISPQRFLTDLQQRLQSPSAETRSVVIGAIKYTLTEPGSELDALLKPLVVQFLAAMKDSDLNVRRAALSSLNAAAHNKPDLIRDNLRELLPLLYQETNVRQELIRIVEMGPFKHQVDDGLETRKTAFECMYTLLENCVDKIDVFAFLDRVLVGMNDLQDIKIVSYMMLVKIAALSPTAAQQKLDETVDIFRSAVNLKPKANAVKQEIERMQELVRASLKAIVHLQRISDPSNTPKFDTFVKELKAGPLSEQLQAVEYEVKQQYHRPSISGRSGVSSRMDLS
ncbi:hypothetical protein RI367_004887 [Sorochytrium milnesiophthora]